MADGRDFIWLCSMWFLQSLIVLFIIQIGIDLIGPFSKSEKGNVYLCTLTDYFTKWAEGVPIPDKRAQTVARVLYETFLRQDLKLGNRIIGQFFYNLHTGA